MKKFAFIGVVFGRVSFEQMYSLGDSISDNGNYYAISGGMTPSSEYYNGRFSNGPTWVEYLATRLKANLRDLAFGKATSDGTQFKVDDLLEVPGCQQQAETLIREYNMKETTNPGLSDHTLVTIAFLGNDFFDPRATPAAISKNLEMCTATILKRTSIKHILIPISTAPELFPYFKADPSQAPRFMRFASEIEASWKDAIIRLQGFNVNFYPLNFREIMYGIKNGTYMPRPFQYTDTPCLLPGKSKCQRPETYMFFDSLHPSTQTHQIIAKAAADILPL